MIAFAVELWWIVESEGRLRTARHSRVKVCGLGFRDRVDTANERPRCTLKRARKHAVSKVEIIAT